MKSPFDKIQKAADAVEVENLILEGKRASDILLRIAERNEFDNPSVSIRAAQAAARTLSGGVSGVLLQQKLETLHKDVAAALEARDTHSQRARAAAAGHHRPAWLKQPEGRRREGDAPKTASGASDSGSATRSPKG